MKKVSLYIAACFLFLISFSANFYVQKSTSFHYGKDEGLVFRVSSLSILPSPIFFTIIKRKVSFGYWFYGFSIGILSYMFVYALYFILGLFDFGNKLLEDISMVNDQIFATGLVFLIGIVVSETNNQTKI